MLQPNVAEIVASDVQWLLSMKSESLTAVWMAEGRQTIYLHNWLRYSTCQILLLLGSHRLLPLLGRRGYMFQGCVPLSQGTFLFMNYVSATIIDFNLLIVNGLTVQGVCFPVFSHLSILGIVGGF